MRDLSVLIPARNEMFLQRTVDSILDAIEADTEIIIVSDGEWPAVSINDHPRVILIKTGHSIGQRAAVNLAAKISTAKFIMKLDAHCAVDKGFDRKLMADCEYDWTVIPRMYNLHAFDWKCRKCGNSWYQSPTPAHCCSDRNGKIKNEKCDSKDFERVIKWKPRLNRKSDFMRFDSDLHFQYWGDFENRPEAQGDIAETMSNLGACFFMHRDRYWELGGLDENHGSWGQMGTEISCKTWLSGGRQVVNKKTWFSHMFRTQGGDFGFPYPLSSKQVAQARTYSKDIWKNNKWPQAKYTLDWLIAKFAPVPGWEMHKPKVNKPKKGVVYYTDNKVDAKIGKAVREQILKGIKEKHVVSVCLDRATYFGKKETVMFRDRGYLTMAQQILKGLEMSDADVVFFCEHDVLYHPSHFDFVPPDKNKVYYNTNVWRVRISDGHGLFTNNLQQLSGLVAYRDILLEHYKKRVALLKKAQEEMTETEFNKYVRQMGFEPGTHKRAERVDDLKAESYFAKSPNIDIRHDSNLTPSRWEKHQFRNQRYTEGWTESKLIPGWGDFSIASLV